MTMFRVMICVLAVWLAPAVVGAQGQVPVVSPGVHDLTFAQTNAPPIHFALSVPQGYRGQPVPLILALHFGGDPNGAGRAMLDILILPAMADLGALIVAPDALGGGGWGSAPNEKAVNALLASVEKSYAIDVTRVIVTGYSMGGAGAWHWAGKYPERFSAAVPVAGRPAEASSPWRVPVFAVHSRDDQVNPIGPTEQRVADLKKSGVNARLVVLTGVSHYETNRFAAALRQAVPWIREVWNAR